MKVQHAHSFDREEARKRLEVLTNYWSTKYGMSSRWSGDTVHVNGKVKGIKFEGDIQVTDSGIAGDVKAGFLAEKLGGKQYVEQKLQEYLDPGNTIEVLRTRGG